jgi:hypothetical protein
MRVLARFCFFAALGASALQATSFSFQGSFSTDDQVQLFTVVLASNSTVTFRTYGYAGGTDSAGTLIPHGGFDPELTWYMSNGTEIGNNNDGGCTNVATYLGACLDSFGQVFLPAGTYTLALTESGNDPNGDLSTGFAQTGNPDFTAIGACAGPFCDFNGDQLNGKWEVDILNVTSATGPASGVPEPGSILLSIGGIALIARAKWRRNNSVN